MKHMVFFIVYIYFLYTDIREQKIQSKMLALYALIAIITLAMTRDTITYESLIDMMFSVAFGLVIYLLSYFSREGIGLADGMYFVINGLLLTLKENIVLFLTGLLVAFVIGIFLYYFGNERSRTEPRMPFLPCFIPAILGYIVCIV